MAVIQIEYDLRRDKDYATVIAAIKSLGAWCHMLESSWLVRGPLLTLDHVYAVMDAAFDANDLWAVHPFIKPASGRLHPTVWTFINESV